MYIPYHCKREIFSLSLLELSISTLAGHWSLLRLVLVTFVIVIDIVVIVIVVVIVDEDDCKERR